MPKIDVSLRLVTPAFVGGALRGRSVPPEGIRPPEIKALLRYWWRATQHGPVSEMAAREAEIFGSRDGSIGRRLRVVPTESLGPRKTEFSSAGTVYPPGFYTYRAYGPVSWIRERQQAESTVPEVAPGHFRRFSIYCRDSDFDQVLKALWLLSAFGGVGSRSRRGWGSLAVTGVDEGWRRCFGSGKDEMNPHTAADTGELCKRLNRGLAASVSDAVTGSPTGHTAFGPSSIVLVGPSQPDWKKAMEVLHAKLNGYRRRLGAVRNHAPQEVGSDFDLRARWSARPGRPSALADGSPSPLGAGFGLPVNGTHGSVGVGSSLNGRRASPVFFNVAKVQNGYAPVVLWLPSPFLPADVQVFARVTDDDPGVRVTQPTAVQGVNTFIHGGTIRRGDGASFAGPSSKTEQWLGLRNEANWAVAWKAQ